MRTKKRHVIFLLAGALSILLSFALYHLDRGLSGVAMVNTKIRVYDGVPIRMNGIKVGELSEVRIKHGNIYAQYNLNEGTCISRNSEFLLSPVNLAADVVTIDVVNAKQGHCIADNDTVTVFDKIDTLSVDSANVNSGYIELADSVVKSFKYKARRK